MRYLKSFVLILSLGVILVGAQTTAAVASGVTMLHVEVTEDHGADPKVSLSLPFEVLEAFANSLDAKEFVAREIIDEMESEGFDLKGFWQEVRDNDIQEFFTMQAANECRRASRSWRETCSTALAASIDSTIETGIPTLRSSPTKRVRTPIMRGRRPPCRDRPGI